MKHNVSFNIKIILAYFSKWIDEENCYLLVDILKIIGGTSTWYWIIGLKNNCTVRFSFAAQNTIRYSLLVHCYHVLAIMKL